MMKNKKEEHGKSQPLMSRLAHEQIRHEKKQQDSHRQIHRHFEHHLRFQMQFLPS